MGHQSGLHWIIATKANCDICRMCVICLVWFCLFWYVSTIRHSATLENPRLSQNISLPAMLTWICHKMLMYNCLCTHAPPHKEREVYRLYSASWQASNQIHTLAKVSLRTEFFPHELGGGGERERSNNVDPLNSVKEQYYCIYTKVPW
jgi:hypothetical protein